MLERRCYDIDFTIAAVTCKAIGLTEEQVNSMKSAFHEIERLRDEILDLECTITMVHDAAAEYIAKDPENEKNIQKIYEIRFLHLAKLIESKVMHQG